MARAPPAAKKLKALRQREAERQMRIQSQIEGWFEEFDTNKDGKLQREELRALLTFLHPSRPPTEQNLDYLVERATAVESSSTRIPGNKNGVVGWHDLRQVVLWYGDYCKDQSYIDSIYTRYDVDGSGKLESTEIFTLLRAVAPEECAVDEADVRYILESFDTDKNGVIDRDELLPMLAKWAQVAYTKVEQQRLEEKRLSVRHQWHNLQGAVASVGDAVVETQVGSRLASIASLARQQQQHTQTVRSRWQTAAHAGSPQKESKGTAILRLVAAAREKQKYDAAVPSGDRASSSDSPAGVSGAGSVGSGDVPPAAMPQTNGVSIEGPLSPRQQRVLAAANAQPPTAEALLAMSKVHSRSSAEVVGDLDGPWRRSDRALARRLSRAAKQARAVEALRLPERTSATDGSARPRPLSVASAHSSSAATHGSSASVIDEEPALADAKASPNPSPSAGPVRMSASPRAMETRPEGGPAKGSGLCNIL